MGKRRVVSKKEDERRTERGWRMVDRARVEKKRIMSKDNIEKEDRKRVEKRRVVSKSFVERWTGRGWRKGE